MANRKPNRKYYYSVEGETEKWYLEWLKDVINNNEASAFTVSILCSVQKNPLKYAKSLVITEKIEVYHLSDYESDDPVHFQQFTQTMNNMKKAREIGKQINYKFGYSNLTFDLWMILHKAECNGAFTHRKNYIIPINNAYEENFECMDEFKHEDNFKRCLKKLQLSNVILAVNRVKTIMQRNKDNGYTLHQYKGYKYYKENPSLTIWEGIDKMLKDCKLY
ncbi:MAG: RloB domain-containing protein [Ruminiclostridium sp.]|nr:RloB domain-containing protein [Ruminiclostridium sp.]